MPSTINSVLGSLAEARTVLISDPGRAAGLLEEIARELQTSPLDRAALEALRPELAAMAKLSRNGEAFWRAWGKLLGLEPGYTAEGVRAAERPVSNIAVQG